MLLMCVLLCSFMGVLSLAGVTIMNDVITAFDQQFGDGLHLCELRDCPGRQPCGYTPVQVVTAFLDVSNLPCNFLPQNQEPAGLNVLHNMIINLINEDSVAAPVVAHGTDTEEGET